MDTQKIRVKKTNDFPIFSPQAYKATSGRYISPQKSQPSLLELLFIE